MLQHRLGRTEAIGAILALETPFHTEYTVFFCERALRFRQASPRLGLATQN
jgi:hypothetical protein